MRTVKRLISTLFRTHDYYDVSTQIVVHMIDTHHLLCTP